MQRGCKQTRLRVFDNCSANKTRTVGERSVSVHPRKGMEGKGVDMERETNTMLHSRHCCRLRHWQAVPIQDMSRFRTALKLTLMSRLPCLLHPAQPSSGG